ncbi:hypothetical protein HDU98_008878 [Podochytrium sp. JEL0797]|nr:hypothetical protein HDU98_008878 [Podochytrium sp. JEL0797]
MTADTTTHTAANVDSEIATMPMDTVSSHRLRVPSFPPPKLFFKHLLTQSACLKQIAQTVERPAWNCVAEMRKDLSWNPHPLLAEYVARVSGTGGKGEGDEEEDAVNSWEDPGTVDFSDVEVVEVLGADCVDIVSYMEEYQEDEDLLAPLLREPARGVRHEAMSVEPPSHQEMEYELDDEGLDVEQMASFDWNEHSPSQFDEPQPSAATTTTTPPPPSRRRDHSFSPLQNQYHYPSKLRRIEDPVMDVDQEQARSPSMRKSLQQPHRVRDRDSMSRTPSVRGMSETRDRLSLPPPSPFFAPAQQQQQQLPPSAAPAFSARRAVESFMNLRQVQAKAPSTRKALFVPPSKPPAQPPIQLIYQPFTSPYSLDSIRAASSAGPEKSRHTYVGGTRVIADANMLEWVAGQNIELVEREYGESSAGGMAGVPMDFDFVVDERTCVISCPAIFLFQRLSLNPTQTTPPFEPGTLYTTLLALSLKFSRILVVVDLSSSSSNHVVQSLTAQMAQAVAEWVVVGKEVGEACGVEVNMVWSQGPEETVRLVREIGDETALSVQVQASAKDSYKNADVPRPWASKEGWEERSWMVPEDSAIVLSQMKLAEFMTLSVQEMEFRFGLWIPVKSLRLFHLLIHSQFL